MKNIPNNKYNISPYVFPLLKYSPVVPITKESIIKTVTVEYNISLDQIQERSRYRKIIIPRQLSIYIMREKLKLTWSEIGRAFGGKFDHTTMIHNYRQAKNFLDTCEETQRHYNSIIENL